MIGRFKQRALVIDMRGPVRAANHFCTIIRRCSFKYALHIHDGIYEGAFYFIR